MNDVRVTQLPMTPSTVVRRSLAILAGAILVALGAQMAVPLPGTPVPITFQVPAVLVVGALLGPRLGAASMVVYLGLGAVGLPVFAPIGAPGLARLLGPTGGYLLAYPMAAALVGVLIRDTRSWLRILTSLVLGVLVIHAGGVAQLAALGGDVSTAVKLGSVPFLLGDVVKVLLAGLIVQRFATKTRALL